MTSVPVYSLVVKDEVKVLGYLPDSRKYQYNNLYYRIFSEKTGEHIATVYNKELLDRIVESFRK